MLKKLKFILTILVIVTVGIRVIHDVIIRIFIAELVTQPSYDVTAARVQIFERRSVVFLVRWNDDWIGSVVREIVGDVISWFCDVKLGCDVVSFFKLFVVISFFIAWNKDAALTVFMVSFYLNINIIFWNNIVFV